MSEYEDIINLPRHISSTRECMSMRDRAAQFAPFAALTGYEDAIDETARLTDSKISLADEEIQEINSRLVFISEHLKEKIRATVVYFKHDERKSGGEYVRFNGLIRSVNDHERVIILETGARILIEDIYSISI